MGTYNVHAGHSLVCRGASGFLDEVNEDRKVKNKVIELLRKEGHTVYDCTDDVGDERGNLANIVEKCNKHEVDIDISIHLNAGGGTGPEVWLYSDKLNDVAARISTKIAKTFGLNDRGVKHSQKLYVLRHTTAPALLVECCFVDSEKDKNVWNADKCAKAIVEGILNKTIVETKPQEPAKTGVVIGPCDFKVKVETGKLKIRKGPSTKYKLTGLRTGKGVFTIVEVMTGKGSNSGWGKLKSGAGWIPLDKVKRV